MTAVETGPDTHAPEVTDRAVVRRRIKLTVTFGLLALLLAWFTLSIENDVVRYVLADSVSADSPAQELSVAPVMWGSTLVMVVLALWAASGRFPRGVPAALLYVLSGLAMYAGFIVWAYSDLTSAFQPAIANPLPGTIRLAAPLIFGALAGVLCERAGVINIAIEGQFLLGAFFAAVGASLAFSPYAGLAGGALAGVAIGALLAVFAMRYQVNQVVLGVVLTALAAGLTSFLLSQIPSDPAIRQYLNEPPILEVLPVPGLSEIPFIGQALFEQTALVYLMYVAVAVVAFLLYQTRWGLRVRAVGEHPKAADTVGVPVSRVRWQAVLLGGALAGLGGAYFTVGSTGAFDNDVSAGNGFIALAAVIMGRWHPVGATAAALFFGFASNLQSQLQLVDKFPTQLLVMTPYIATIIAVAGLVGRVRPPAADGEPYVKG